MAYIPIAKARGFTPLAANSVCQSPPHQNRKIFSVWRGKFPPRTEGHTKQKPQEA